MKTNLLSGVAKLMLLAGWIVVLGFAHVIYRVRSVLYV